MDLLLRPPERRGESTAITEPRTPGLEFCCTVPALPAGDSYASTSMAQRQPGASASRRSAVTRVVLSASASATYAAS